MSIIGTFPTTIANGQPEDATVVMSLFSWIQSQVNGNGCPATTTNGILKGDGSGGTTLAISGIDYVSPNSDYVVATGSANTYVATYSPPIVALTDGVKVRFKAPAANTAASTLNVSGLGVKPIYNYQGCPLVGGEIINNGNIEVTYNTAFNGGAGAWVIENTIAMVPVGSKVRWAAASLPIGWLLCNGQAVSRTAFAALFAVLGTTYGSGDGSTTFNLPNSTDRMSIGAGNLYALGATGGSKDAIVVSHTHTATSTVTDSGHKHTSVLGVSNPATVEYGATSGVIKTLDGAAVSNRTGAYTSTETTGIAVGTTNAATGSSGTSANLPPYIADYEIIKA